MRNRFIPSLKGRTEPAFVNLMSILLSTPNSSCSLYHFYIQQIMQLLILSTLEGS